MSQIQYALFSAAMHKRKRSENDISGTSSDRVIKRPTTLAIRSPPPSRPTSLFSNVSAFSPFSGQLTPVDTSEDESVTQEDIWSSNSRVPDLSDSVDSASSIKVHVSSPHSQHGETSAITDDADMDLTPSNPSRPRIGRARSNDILSSPPRRLTTQQATLLSPDPTATAFPHDRVPTPITGHFDSRLDNLPSAARHSLPPIHTNLSPMMEQDTWGSLNSASYPNPNYYGQNSLPSPALDDRDEAPVFSRPTSPTLLPTTTAPAADGDAEMMLDEATTSSMSSLRVSGSSEEDDVMEAEEGSHVIRPLGQHHQRQQQQQHRQRPGWSQQQQQTGHARNASSQSGRTARLHMGFLAGCEKCLQKVPGHYSHILWSKTDDS